MKRELLMMVLLIFGIGCTTFPVVMAQRAPDISDSKNTVKRRVPGVSIPRQYPRVEYDADLRPFVFMGGLTNKTRTPSNPYGEHLGWMLGDQGVIYDHLDLGLDRTILRQPVGPGTIGWVLFSSWHPLSAEQKLDFANGVRDWKGEKHSRKVGIFFGRDATDPFIRRDVGISEGPLLRLDPRDPQALQWWFQNIQPLMDIGIDEAWLDRGSANDSPETRKAIVQLARRMRLLLGFKIGVEAIPQTYGEDGEPDRSLGPDWSYMTKVPAMGRWRNLWHSWIKHGYRDTLAVPAELRGKIEVHCFITAADNPPPTQTDVEWLAERGWIISYLNRLWEPESGPLTCPDPSRAELDVLIPRAHVTR